MSHELDHEEDYASEEDSDFAPDDAPPAEDSSASDDEYEGEANSVGEKHASRNCKQPAENTVEDAGFENSGDEAIIENGQKKRRKKKTRKQNGEADLEDAEDGGEGGLVKTRSMRATEKEQRRIATVTGPVTVDVDALWAQMTSGPIATSAPEATDRAEKPTSTAKRDAAILIAGQVDLTGNGSTPEESSNMIKIKRTYNFAGKVHTEEKLVSRYSAEAKLYIASLGGDIDQQVEAPESEPKRVPRKAFRSAFEPITEQMLQRADLDLGLAARLRARELSKQANAKKLNTVEKSRMDWAGFVDKEGYKDELELAGKSKHSFAARQEFLARSEARLEEDARRVRLAERA